MIARCQKWNANKEADIGGQLKVVVDPILFTCEITTVGSLRFLAVHKVAHGVVRPKVVEHTVVADVVVVDGEGDEPDNDQK